MPKYLGYSYNVGGYATYLSGKGQRRAEQKAADDENKNQEVEKELEPNDEPAKQPEAEQPPVENVVVENNDKVVKS